MTTPLLSVVIPTKDRAEYAVHCIRALTRLPADALEIVVQDNSATPALGAALSEMSDARVRYEHRGGPLSVIDNCERGMARARGEYVTLLGDDDGVTSALWEAAGWAAREGLDAVTPSRTGWYVWPDVRYARFGMMYADTLTIRPYTGRVTLQDADSGVRRSLRQGLQDLVETVALPKLYYGLIHRRCLAALLAEAGSIFPGVSPDMSAAMGLSKYVRRFASVDYPVFLPGASARSTAGAGARKEHVGRLEDQPHLPRGCAETWPVEVPRVFAVQTVWAQSGLAALRATGRGHLSRELDLGYLHATCGLLNPGHWSIVVPSYWRAVDAIGASRVGAALGLAQGVARTYLLRARYLTARFTNAPWYAGEHVDRGLGNIMEAVEALERWMARKGIRPSWAASPAD